jgi:CxxC motif-containing protein
MVHVLDPSRQLNSMKSSRPISRAIFLMMMTEVALVNSVQYRHLTRPIARGDVIVSDEVPCLK